MAKNPANERITFDLPKYLAKLLKAEAKMLCIPVAQLLRGTIRARYPDKL